VSFVWFSLLNSLGDGSNMYRSATPYKHEKTELDRLEKAFRNYQRKEQPPVKWLDDLTFRRVEKLQVLFDQVRNSRIVFAGVASCAQ